jgi:hypothetical protein
VHPEGTRVKIGCPQLIREPLLKTVQQGGDSYHAKRREKKANDQHFDPEAR